MSQCALFARFFAWIVTPILRGNRAIPVRGRPAQAQGRVHRSSPAVGPVPRRRLRPVIVPRRNVGPNRDRWRCT